MTIVQAHEYSWSNLAGKPGGAGHLDGSGVDVRLGALTGIAVDSAGNALITCGNHTVRMITPSGTVSTIAGQPSSSGAQDGFGVDARFFNPFDVAVDRFNNAYITDHENHIIRKMTPGGLVTTFVGTGANLFTPAGIAISSTGYLYVTEKANHTIRRISPQGAVTLWAGRIGEIGNANGARTAARFAEPHGIAIDKSGNVYVADCGNHVIRKITPAGVVSTLAGMAGEPGTTDGVGAAARFLLPQGVVVDNGGNVYVADTFNGTIRKITPNKQVTTLAGTAEIYGRKDGTGAAASFGQIRDLAITPSGDLLVTDPNSLIRKVTPAGVVTTYAGNNHAGRQDGTGGEASFNRPERGSLDSSGNLYVADRLNHVIRKITPDGVVTTVAGDPGRSGRVDGTGSDARFKEPADVVVDSSGNLFVADAKNHSIRRISTAGVVSTFAGIAASSSFIGDGNLNGTGTAARFRNPTGLAIDAGDNLYVADAGNRLIRKITPAAVVSTLAGPSSPSGWSFSSPVDVAVSPSGNLYVADQLGNTIYKVTSSGAISLLAGSLSSRGFRDAAGNLALFDYPQGVAVADDETVYVADTGNGIIRRVATATREVTTVGGTAGVLGGRDGKQHEARFFEPTGLVMAPDLTLYLMDAGNHRISKGTAIFPPTVALTAVTNLTATSARLNGTVNPHGLATTAVFEYALADSFGTSTGWSQATQMPVTLAPADGNGQQAVSVDISGLTIGMTYYYRLNATNPDGSTTTVRGALEAKGVLDAHFGTPDSVPQTTPHSISTLYLSSSSLGSVTFSFPPQMSAVYTLISNQGAFNNGTFQGLPEGALVTGTHGRDTFHFAISYRRSSGRDLRYNEVVLTRVPGPGQVMQYEWQTYAGAAGQMGAMNGSALAARFNSPFDVCADRAGQVFVTDRGNHAVRKISSGGQVTTFAGSLRSIGSMSGKASVARFNMPTDITIKGPGVLQLPDHLGWLFVSDWGGHMVRMLSPEGEVYPLAGMAGRPGSADGVYAKARLHWPSGLAHDGSNKLCMADAYNGLLRTVVGDFLVNNKLQPDRQVTTVAGRAELLGATDGPGADARFRYPSGLTADIHGSRLYVADFGNHTIRSCTTPPPMAPNTPYVTALVAGTPGLSGSTDGLATTARFNYPRDVAFHQGSVYVADYRNHTIRVISPQGMVSTIGGVALQPGTADGVGTQARFRYPSGLGFSFDGVLYVADSGNHRVCAGVPGSLPLVTLGGVTGQGSGTVLLAGTVNANGLMTTAQFEYGPTTAYGSTAAATPATVNDTTARAVSAALTGLTAGAVYHYRLTATNVDGTNTTVDGTFTAP